MLIALGRWSRADAQVDFCKRKIDLKLRDLNSKYVLVSHENSVD